MEKKVIIYSSPTCHFCKQAKEYFADNNIQFEDRDVLSNEEYRQEMVDKSGQMGTPVILVDDQVVVGFDKDKLEELLK